MYGRRKTTRWLRRQGHDVPFCTVDRIMRHIGLTGVVRGRKQRTTIRAKDGAADPVRAGDQLNRDFAADAPNQARVADFTYVSTWAGWTYVSTWAGWTDVSTWAGWTYVAFVFDVYSRAIVGWTAASSKTTALVAKALNMALWRRDHYGRSIEPELIHHSDAGSQRGFNRSSQHRVVGASVAVARRPRLEFSS